MLEYIECEEINLASWKRVLFVYREEIGGVFVAEKVF